LKNQGKLEAYNQYVRSTTSAYGNLALKTELFYNPYPDLHDLVNSRVLNKTFGSPNHGKNVITSQEALELLNDIAKESSVQSISVVIGGPPCQAYSLIGRGRMKEQVFEDDRNYLFKYYLNIVREFQPRLFVFENVPGIISAGKGDLLTAIRREFEDIGYGLKSGPDQENHANNIIDCKDFGVYQNRRRLILFGYKKKDYPGGFDYPDLHGFSMSFDEPLNTKNAISDLPPLHAGQGADFWYGRYSPKRRLSLFQGCMREESPGVLNHFARPHREQDLKIYEMQIAASKKGTKIGYSELPESLQFHKNGSKKVFEDRFRVHGTKETPHTIVAHISKDGHYNIHPDPQQLRSLTVREAARIQSFPDNYFFEGYRTAQFVQVGNAVPPLLSRAIAKAVKKELDDHRGLASG
ncbi:MAG: DNA cytosine methyltransferase, partial [Clostridiaceae bacterium]|nr:DNA cytosine methyltransferase [Clostridiaceae bacterium]